MVKLNLTILLFLIVLTVNVSINPHDFSKFLLASAMAGGMIANIFKFGERRDSVAQTANRSSRAYVLNTQSNIHNQSNSNLAAGKAMGCLSSMNMSMNFNENDNIMNFNEDDNFMSFNEDDHTVNPATGLPMMGGIGGVDCGGNIFGQDNSMIETDTGFDSFDNSQSSFDDNF